ncbi:hypothetical protein FMM56_06060 [Campylobacter sp. LR264d]|nr:hypothetical protein FMM56_06060 [Campylobacter sp. LR264d]
MGISNALYFALNNLSLQCSYQIQISKKEEDWTKLGQSDFELAINNHPNNYDLALFTGFNTDKKSIYLDINGTHLFVIGTSGSGKSVLLKTMVLYLLKTSMAKLYVYDCKNDGDFDIFKQNIKIYHEANDMLKHVDEVEALRVLRSDDKKENKGFEPIVIFIDEASYSLVIRSY